MRAQLITDHAGTCFVIGAGRVDGGNANQARREVDDLVARTIDLGDDTIDGGALHSVNPI